MKATNRTILSAALALGPTALPATAQDGGGLPRGAGEDQLQDQPPTVDLGDVLVTARKREEAPRNVPASTTVVTGSELEAAGITSLSDAAIFVPNLRLTEFTARRLSLPFLRGVGSGVGEPAVTTYVDGVPQLTTGSTNLPLIGLERVEFLRGPQALYGRNSLGGVIHLVSARPTRERQARADLTLGDHGRQELELSWSGPVGEDVLFRFDGLYEARDGYTRNDFTGDDVDERRSFFGREQVLLRPTERSELRLGIYGQSARDGGFALYDLPTLRARPHHINQDFEGVAERDVLSPFVTWTRYGDSVDFTAITSYTDWDLLETSDFDFTAIDGVRRRTEESQRHFNEELRLSSAEEEPVALGGRATLEWLAGVHVFVADSERSAANEFRPGLFPVPALDASRGEFEDLGLGVFGQATVTIDERLELALGLRYDDESKEAGLRHTLEVGGFPVSDDTTALDDDFGQASPSFSAAWHFDDETMAYASAAKAYKAGGFNLTAPPDRVAFGPEQSWTYEVGLRKSWDEERVTASAAAFHIDWEDMQLSQFEFPYGGFVDNVGASTSQGLELEVTARVRPGLRVFSGLGLLDTEIDQFVDSFSLDDSGNDLPFAPDQTWHVGAQLEGDVSGRTRWFARAEIVGVGDFFYDASNLEGDSFELVNLRAGVERGDWRLALWVRNAFDEEYVPVAFQPDPTDPTAFVGENGAPRTLGVSFGMSF